MANKVDCIEKRDRMDPTEAISYIGGHNSDGSRWKITQQDAVRRIESGQNEFFVEKNGRAVYIVVAVSRFGNKYIKTKADDYEPNNLLSLTTCSLAA